MKAQEAHMSPRMFAIEALRYVVATIQVSTNPSSRCDRKFTGNMGRLTDNSVGALSSHQTFMGWLRYKQEAPRKGWGHSAPIKATVKGQAAPMKGKAGLAMQR